MQKILGSNHFMIARMAFHGRMSDEEFERMNRRNKTTQLGRLRVGARPLSDVRGGRRPGRRRNRSEAGRHRVSRRAWSLASTANMVDIEDKTIADGRFISADEVERSALVVCAGRRHQGQVLPEHRSRSARR